MMEDKELWYEIFHIMRNWNREWNKFMGSSNNPKCMDELIEEFIKKYKLSRDV